MKGMLTSFPLPDPAGQKMAADPASIRFLKRNLKRAEQAICKVFLDAVNANDGQRVLEIARAVWFFKDKRYPKFTPVDRERTMLLFLKDIKEHSAPEPKLTIREVANFVATGRVDPEKKIDTPADGFSALRRKCKQPGIPLAESRKTSQK